MNCGFLTNIHINRWILVIIKIWINIKNLIRRKHGKRKNRQG